MRGIFAALITIGLATPALGHGGGLNAAGCHNDRKNGGYHCHRGPSVSAPVAAPRRSAAPAAAPRRALVPSTPLSSYRAPSTLLSNPAPAVADSKIETIQKLLLRLGYQPGPATGRMTPATQFAIMKFEEKEGMPIKGEASSLILDALLSRITG